MEIDKIYQGDCLEVLKTFEDNSIDLTLTSPPYDNLRTYGGVIDSWSNEGDIVLNPFMGSGTTGFVANKLGRHYVGIELNPEYVEMAKKRIGLEQSQLTLF